MNGGNVEVIRWQFRRFDIKVKDSLERETDIIWVIHGLIMRNYTSVIETQRQLKYPFAVDLPTGKIPCQIIYCEN